jgi:signal transduction histidine kinase
MEARSAVTESHKRGAQYDVLVITSKAHPCVELKRQLQTARQVTFNLANVSSLENALTLLSNRHFDGAFIALDFEPSKEDSFAAIKKLQSLDGHMAVIVVSSKDDEDLSAEVIQSGADDYVVPEKRPDSVMVRTTIMALERRRALNKLDERVKELAFLNEEKEMFLQIASHDLRNPLSAVMGAAAMIENNLSSLNHGEVVEFAQHIREHGERMLTLVKNYLDISEIESGKKNVQLGMVDITQTVRAVKEAHKAWAQRKEIVLDDESEDPALFVGADADILSQILANLISNAIKFSPRKSRVQVRLAKTEGLVQCSVTDEGPGISKTDQERLFKKFSRLSARPTAGEASTGLGLAITKRLVESVGGTIRCVSDGVHGTTFVVTLTADEVKGRSTPALS